MIVNVKRYIFSQSRLSCAINYTYDVCHFTGYPFQGHRRWRWFQLTLVEGRATLWISFQFITGLIYREKQPFTLTFASTGNLEQPNFSACNKHANSTQPSAFLLCSNSAKHCAAILQIDKHHMCSSWQNSSWIKESFESSFSKIRSHGANQKACDFDSL